MKEKNFFSHNNIRLNIHNRKEDKDYVSCDPRLLILLLCCAAARTGFSFTFFFLLFALICGMLTQQKTNPFGKTY